MPTGMQQSYLAELHYAHASNKMDSASKLGNSANCMPCSTTSKSAWYKYQAVQMMIETGQIDEVTNSRKQDF